MATTVTIQTGGKAVELKALNTASRDAKETRYTVPPRTTHTFSLPDAWTFSMSDA